MKFFTIVIALFLKAWLLSEFVCGEVYDYYYDDDASSVAHYLSSGDCVAQWVFGYEDSAYAYNNNNNNDDDDDKGPSQYIGDISVTSTYEDCLLLCILKDDCFWIQWRVKLLDSVYQNKHYCVMKTWEMFNETVQNDRLEGPDILMANPALRRANYNFLNCDGKERWVYQSEMFISRPKDCQSWNLLPACLKRPEVGTTDSPSVTERTGTDSTASTHTGKIRSSTSKSGSPDDGGENDEDGTTMTEGGVTDMSSADESESGIALPTSSEDAVIIETTKVGTETSSQERLTKGMDRDDVMTDGALGGDTTTSSSEEGKISDSTSSRGEEGVITEEEEEEEENSSDSDSVDGTSPAEHDGTPSESGHDSDHHTHGQSDKDGNYDTDDDQADSADGQKQQDHTITTTTTTEDFDHSRSTEGQHGSSDQFEGDQSDKAEFDDSSGIGTNEGSDGANDSDYSGDEGGFDGSGEDAGGTIASTSFEITSSEAARQTLTEEDAGQSRTFAVESTTSTTVASSKGGTLVAAYLGAGAGAVAILGTAFTTKLLMSKGASMVVPDGLDALEMPHTVSDPEQLVSVDAEMFF